MRVLYINSLFGENSIGGAEKITELLAREILCRGHNVLVVALHQGRGFKIEHINGIKTIFVPLDNIYWPFKSNEHNKIEKLLWHIRDAWNTSYYNVIRAIIEEYCPDIVHMHNIVGFSSVSIKAVPENIPIVLTLHDYYFKCYRSTMFKENRRCDKQCFDCKAITFPRKIASNRVDALCGVSNFILSTIGSNGYFLNAKKYVVNNVIESNISFQNDSNENIVFGYIGKINSEKGIINLIEVVQKLRSLRSNWKLIVAGDGDKDLKRQLEYLGDHVTYIGRVKSSEFYKLIDALIVPSIWNDPYPTVALEAIATGLPVIGRNRGGIPEIVSKISDDLIFNEDDELLELMIKLIDKFNTNEFDNIRMKSREVATGNTIESWVDCYEDIYTSFSEKN